LLSENRIDPFLLQCKRLDAAMQTQSLPLASGIPKLAADEEVDRASQEKGEPQMSKTAAISLAPSTSLFGRLMASFDRLLTASARIAVRNGDLPRFGL
jgi:hypothetical protein